ncbi:hypothetical protein [Heterosigma akashiwo virus 01]|jgi:hypothetical protein|uniref:Uncharacterized protein n=1 Tax=Heterosigma akashiwo virus 01 TaxID=97195 RepID=A0A1C9C4Y7_HAV01|nr:hypothetical protein D1R72_gp019 [Heterosigma akashiwo virus 01]AOM63350.1 hypothetical protein [Heterosigma akashiwo virus 01]
MAKFINETIISINSDENNYTFTFEQPVPNVISVEIIRAKVPSSEYTFEETRNNFYYNGNFYSFPVRNFASSELISWVETKIPGLDVSERTRTGAFLFSSSSAFTLKGGTAYKQLGLVKDVLYTSSASGTNHVIESPKRFDLIGTDVVYVYLEEIDSQINKGIGFMHLGELYLQGLGVTTFQQLYNVPTRWFQPISQLTKLTLRFYRDYERKYPYQFRGIEWYLQVRVQNIEVGKNWSEISDVGLSSAALDSTGGTSDLSSGKLSELTRLMRDSIEEQKKQSEMLDNLISLLALNIETQIKVATTMQQQVQDSFNQPTTQSDAAQESARQLHTQLQTLQNVRPSITSTRVLPETSGIRTDEKKLVGSYYDHKRRIGLI